MLTAKQRKERQAGIGGSDAAAIASFSKWKSAVDVYLEKIGEIEPSDLSGNEAVYFGSLLENIVAEEYARRTGYTVECSPSLLKHSNYPWMIANIDRWVKTNNETRVLECKTASAYSFQQWGEEHSDEIPTDYLLQIAHYAIVCNVAVVDLAVLIGGQRFRLYTYYRNQKLEEKLIELEHDFWHNHVLKKEPPQIKSYRDALALWSHDNGSEITIADHALIDNINQLQQLKQQIKQFEQAADALQADITANMRNATTLLDYSGCPLATWKTQTSQRFDTTAFKHSHPELYKQFTKPISSRVFRLKENKHEYCAIN